MRKFAHLSRCGAYRYSLIRIWDDELPMLGVVMLNPSTADASKDDPTIRKVVGFATRLGYGGIEVVNLFGYRATKPDDLWARLKFLCYGDDDSDPQNESAWEAMLSRCPVVLEAWGAHERKGFKADQVRRFRAMAARTARTTFALATTEAGDPRHPLYLPYDLTNAVPDSAKAVSDKGGEEA